MKVVYLFYLSALDGAFKAKKMTLQELRVGNWVDFPNITEKGAMPTYCKIKSIAQSGGHIEQHPERYLYHIDWLKPIHLDEAWLLKLGFEKDSEEKGFSGGDLWWDSIGCFSIERNQDDTKDTWWFETPGGGHRKFIQYVHQLQNLYFALTGTELQIKEKV